MHGNERQWRPVVGYEGRYEVSDTGIVRSFLGRNVIYLVPIKMHRGHLTVSLCKNGKMAPQFIHRLVLEAFVGPCPPGMMCRHLNGDPSDNDLENLRWGTASENGLDTVLHGKHHQKLKTHCPQGHEYAGDNLRVHGTRRVCRACQIARARTWRKNHTG
jgi:hypothetical protein